MKTGGRKNERYEDRSGLRIIEDISIGNQVDFYDVLYLHDDVS